jgi:ATP-binding cassette subfamily F protein uup
MVWIDRGATRRLEKGFAHFETWRDEVLEQEELEAHKLGRQIVREEDWLRYGVTARRKRNVRRLAELHALRQRRRERVHAPGAAKLAAFDAGGSGTLVIAATGISKSYDGVPILRDVSTRILRGDRVGIVGPNGAGKTTLLNILTGAMAPDGGEVALGTGLVMITLDQKRESLDPALSLADTLSGGRGDQVLVGGQTRHVLGYMKDFLFTPEQARMPVGALSGGERGRLLLARALARPSNLLVLDEPTNDLDIETLDLLQELLAEYPGTVIVVSHDRDFLDRVATSVIVAEGNGRWQDYAGGYSDMLAQRGRGVEAKAPLPTVGRTRDGARPDAPATSAPAPAAARPRLSFKQRHALQTLPGRMEAMRARIAVLGTELADPGLYARDRAGFAARSEELARTETELAAAEEEWLELEILREAIEGG